METFPKKSFKEREAESDKRTEELIEKLIYKIIIEKDQIDRGLALIDRLVKKLSDAPAGFLNEEERKIFDKINEIRGKIGTNEKGEVVDVYNGNELIQIKEILKSFLDLRKKTKERQHSEGAGAGNSSSEIGRNKKFLDESISIIPDEIKNDPDYLSSINLIEDRAKKIVLEILKKRTGRVRGYSGHEEEAEEKIRENAEISVWKEFAQKNPEKAKQWAEFIPSLQYAIGLVSEKKDKVAVSAGAIKWKQEQKPPEPKKFEATDYKINIPEELKDDPDIKTVVEHIQRDIYLVLKPVGRISPEALETIGHNAEARKWFSFARSNPEKAKEIAEKYGDKFPQLQRALSKIKPQERPEINDVRTPEVSKIDQNIEKEARNIVESAKDGIPMFVSKKLQVTLEAFGFTDEQISKNSPAVLIEELAKKIKLIERPDIKADQVERENVVVVTNGVDKKKIENSEFTQFGDKTRSILTEDEMRTIAATKPSAEFDRKKFKKEGLKQGARIVDKLADERIKEEKEKLRKFPEELEKKRREEAEDVGIPTVEFYDEADKERSLKEQAANQYIATVSDSEKRKEEISVEQEIKIFDPKVVEKFSELGVSANELSKIEGFENLSAGQQYLVLESFEQLILGKIKENAIEQYKEKVKKAGPWEGLKKRISKKYQIAKIEKSALEDLAKFGIAPQKDLISQVVKSVKEQGTDAIINKEGELELKYISGLENLNSEEREKINRFNEAAAQLSKIPYEWSLETAGFRQRTEYLKIKNKYDNAFIYASEILTAKKGLEKGQETFLDIQNKIRFNQFINTHPEVEKELQNIKTKSALRRIWQNIALERGMYFGVGYGVRGVSASLLVGGAGVGVVVSAAGFAAWRANNALKEQDIMARRSAGFPKATEEQQKILKEKSKELAEKEQWLKARFPDYVKAENDYLEEIVKLNKKEKAGEAPTVQEVEFLEQLKAKYEKEQFKFELDPLFLEYDAKKSEYEKLRSGIFPDKKTAEEERKKNVVVAESLSQKIEDLVNKIESETDKNKKQKLSESLRVRLVYTDGKLKNGLVNFGAYEKRFLNNCNLMNNIQRATATLAIFGDPKIESELGKRLEKLLDLKKRKISKARRNYLVKEAGKGALYGALFFGLGYGARWLWNEYGHYIKEGITDILPQKPFLTETEHYFEETKEAVSARPGGGAESMPIGAYKSESLAQEIQAQPIGKRGPEGAIIDYFKTNKQVAKQFGYDEKTDFNKWAGTKAHQLWLKHAQDTIKNPDIQETLKKLGYAPDEYTKGYEEMMRHVSNGGGGVKIDISKGNVDLVDMEYLKFKAPAVLEDIPTSPKIDEGILSGQETTGAILSSQDAPEALDNVISVNALPSVEWFAFEDMKFSIGEFGAIKNIPVEKLLKEIPSRDEAWSIWRGEVADKSIDLPHYKTYWYTQFKRQVNLAEQIRQIAKAQKINPDVLKNISIGKFIEKYIAPNLGAK